MKLQKYIKYIIFLLLLSNYSISNVKATDYACQLSGDNQIVLPSKKFSGKYGHYYDGGELEINVTNIEDIASFTIYIEYDPKKVWPFNCHLFNIADGGCPVTGPDTGIVWKQYKSYSRDNYMEELKKYSLFYVSFAANDTYSSLEAMKIKVSFQDAIDRDGNSITIEPCTRTFEFIDKNKIEQEENLSNENSANTGDVLKEINDENSSSFNETKPEVILEAENKSMEEKPEIILESENKPMEEKKITEDTSKSMVSKQETISKNKNIQKQKDSSKEKNAFQLKDYIYIIVPSFIISIVILIIVVIKSRNNNKLWNSFDKL